MKLPFFALLRVFGLAALIWIFFFLLFPSRPPQGNQNLIIVLVALVLERSGVLVWRVIRRRPRPPEPRGPTVAEIVVLGLLGSGLAWDASAAPASMQDQGETEVEAAAVGQPEANLVLVCRPERRSVTVGGRVELRAFVAPEVDQPVWTWSAPVGEIVGSSGSVTWEIGDAEPGYYSATAELQTGDGRTAACTIEVRVRTGTMGGTSLRGRSLLDCGSEEKERRGYGLYSYLLFPASPSRPELSDRYLAALQAFADWARDVEEFQLKLPRREINMTHLPVRGGIDPPSQRYELPLWLLEHYAWGCAQELLSLVPGDHDGPGPYLVSIRRRLAADGPIRAEEEFLYQDLSWVDRELMELWIQEFLIQTGRVRFWEPRTGPRLALHLRTSLSLLGQATDAVRPAISDWLQWFGEPSD